jgi:hypothetical protein
MGSPGDPAMRDALLALKKRVIAKAAAEAGQGLSACALVAALDAKNTQAALDAAAALTSEYYMHEDASASSADADADAPTFSARVSRLVSMCEGALRTTFDLSGLNAAIHTDRVRRAQMSRAAPAAQVPIAVPHSGDSASDSASSDSASASASTFECPVLLDSDASAQDVLLLLANDTPPVLEGEDAKVVNECLDCPLNALKFPSVVSKLLAKLDHPISLLAWKQLETSLSGENRVESGGVFDVNVRSPLTRRPVVGGLCLGLDEAHAKATTWALDRVLLGGKRVGNPDLWFAVVWLLLKDVSKKPAWISEAVVEKAQAHMAWRLQHHTSFLALTGLPELPTTRVPLKAALW